MAETSRATTLRSRREMEGTKLEALVDEWFISNAGRDKAPAPWVESWLQGFGPDGGRDGIADERLGPVGVQVWLRKVPVTEGSNWTGAQKARSIPAATGPRWKAQAVMFMGDSSWLVLRWRRNSRGDSARQAQTATA